MTRGEAKKAALGSACPYCGARPGSRCFKTVTGSGVRTTRIREPHVERMKTVPEWAAQLEAKRDEDSGVRDVDRAVRC